MCLGIPMKISQIKGREAIVESGGLKRKIGLQLMKNVKPGDYVIVHAGFAIEKLDEKNAKETLNLLRRIGMRQ